MKFIYEGRFNVICAGNFNLLGFRNIFSTGSARKLGSPSFTDGKVRNNNNYPRANGAKRKPGARVTNSARLFTPG